MMETTTDTVRLLEVPGRPRRYRHAEAFARYAPRARRSGEWGDCETDGHYLCEECCHRAQPVEEAAE